MRLLWVTPYLPYPVTHGGKSRVFNVLMRIAEQHEVHLLAVNDTGAAADLGPLGARCASVTLVPYTPPGTVWGRASRVVSALPQPVAEFTSRVGMSALRSLLANHAFDAAVIEQVQAAEYQRPLRRAGVPTLLVCH